MSPIDKPVPPAGEDIHLPEGSIQPLLLTVSLTVALVGVTTSIWLVIGGGIVAVATIGRWIADTRREINELPLEHEHH